MNVKVIFSNRTGVCRLDILHENGRKELVPFESVSEMVGWCNENDIEVTVGDCRVEY